jgi:hypothetical protein
MRENEGRVSRFGVLRFVNKGLASASSGRGEEAERWEGGKGGKARRREGENSGAGPAVSAARDAGKMPALP